MNIEKNAVVRFHYTVSEVDGEQMETSRDAEPLAILVGHGNLFPTMEEAMMGKTTGDTLQVTLTPEQGYGERNEANRQRVSLKHLVGKKKPRAGELVKVNTDQGPRDAMVLKVGFKTVDLDTNHPFAGKHLSFDIEIVEVREASEEEISHGHAHGDGGHHH